jgi:hypothetical protein
MVKTIRKSGDGRTGNLAEKRWRGKINLRRKADRRNG